MANATTKIADELASHQVELLQLAASKSRKLIPLLEQLETDLERLIKRKDLTSATRARINSMLASARDEVASAYSDIQLAHDLQLGRVVSSEVQITDTIINDTVGADIFDTVLPRSALDNLATDTLVQGAPSAEWWSRQAGDVSFRFAAEMRTGIAAGETNGQLIDRLMNNVMDVAKRNAEALVRTSVITTANAARLEVYKQNSDVLNGVQQISTLDERTTDICIAYDGQAWSLDGEPLPGSSLPFQGGPPRHWNCRSVLVPVTKSFESLGVASDELSQGERASLDGEVAADTTFNDWLGRQSQERQNQVLGVGRADLWRDGKITLTNLLDQSGRPLTLEELQARYH